MASVLMDKIGRKNSLLCAAIPYLISWFIIGLTQRLGFLLLARCIGGIGDGVVYTILPVYIAEIVDPQIRGFVISFVGILAIFGGLLINVYGYYLNIAYSSLLCAVPSSIFLIFFYFLPETPNYFIVRKNLNKAREVLGRIRGRQIDESEIEDLVKINEEGLVKASIFDLFRVRGNRRGLFIFMGTMTTQQFSGIIPIMFYTQTIFEEAAADFPVIASTVLLYIVLIIFSSVSAVIVDRLGRRPLIITSTALSCLFLLTEGVNLYIKSEGGVGNVGSSWVTIVDLSFLIVSFSIGLLSIPTVFQGEFFPLNVKAAAVCFCNIYFAVMASIAAKLFQITNDKYGLYFPFFMFSVVCGLGLVFAVIFVPETKNKTLEEIQIELKALNIDAKNVTKL
ncbi:hypothetical protein RI129_011090 [Pyrocoelia pectoralis]|uniref:Major facilitator superfamily (MFS) profile domain-containing protein n=1 Tax=Pyrocoelia pectoralis TaxID=417401 RepID=A0AAN7VBE0_9COLE